VPVGGREREGGREGGRESRGERLRGRSEKERGRKERESVLEMKRYKEDAWVKEEKVEMRERYTVCVGI